MVEIDYNLVASIWGTDPANEHVIPMETVPEPVQSETTEEAPKAEAEEIIINGQHEVGTIIEYKGRQWFVAASENYSAQDQQEDEEGGMGSLPIGWHSWLVEVQPGNQALPVLVELLKEGKATLNSSQTVMFPDEQYSSFLRDLEYSSELGLYDRSKVQI
jgi:hypothetical protein